MEVSCGFILIDPQDGRILGCHPTGMGDVYDIPKGCKQKGEGALACAIRELREETGIILEKDIPYFDCGEMEYRKDKKIHLFIHPMKLDFLLDMLRCSSIIDHGERRGEKEMDGYMLFSSYEKFYPSLQKILPICIKMYQKL